MNTTHNVVNRLANILNNFKEKVFLGKFRTQYLLYDIIFLPDRAALPEQLPGIHPSDRARSHHDIIRQERKELPFSTRAWHGKIKSKKNFC